MYGFQHSIKFDACVYFPWKQVWQLSYIHDVICEQVSKRTVKRHLVFYFPAYITYSQTVTQEEVSDKQPMVWNIMVGGLGISWKHRNIHHTDAMNKTTVHIA